MTYDTAYDTAAISFFISAFIVVRQPLSECQIFSPDSPPCYTFGMNVSQEQAARLGFWAVLILSVFAWGPATYPGYWQAQEGFVPVFNALRGGAIAGIGTVPDLWRGMGNGAFLPAQPFIVLGLSATAAVRVVFGLSFLFGGMGMYIWLRNRLGDRAAGLAALMLMLWPPLLVTVYMRGSLADALVVGIVPLALAGLATYVETRAPSAAGVAVLSLLWIWRTQAGLAVFVTLLLLAYVLVVERSRLAALVVGVSGAAGLVSLVPLWDIRSPAPIDFGAQYLSLYGLLTGGEFFLAFDAMPVWAGDMAAPISLGVAFVVFGLAALWFWRTSRLGWQTNVLARMLAFAWAVILLTILLALPPSRPFWELTQSSRLFTYPWQLLLVAGPFFALAAGSLPTLQPVLARTRLWIVLVALVLLGGYPFLRADFTQVPAPERPVALFGSINELIVLDAQLTEDRAAGMAVLELTWQVIHTPDFDYNVFFQAQEPENGAFRTVAQLDTQPMQGQLPATSWQPGQIYTDTYQLDLSPWLDSLAHNTETGNTDTGNTDTQAGEVGPPLRFDFGYYDWRDGRRLPIDGGIDDKLMFYGR